jgi:2-keto-4-pentenoate hydratase
VLGHPLNSIAWLCEHLARRNARIEAGQWVMTGSIVPTRFPQAGDHYLFEIAGLPPVEARIAARVAGQRS